ncbi:MAG: undecaprenyl-diphosphate phosphatase [Acidobacteria bacterium]|nr:undecaprenyl-diphosphate phosphatase [Acidobacteriota bacterium]
MSLIKAIVLGIVQGVTEFLPISSSGHLVVIGNILAVDTGGSVLFDILLHGGTLVVIIIYFREEIKSILFGFVRKDEEGRRFILPIIVAIVATGAVVLPLKGIAEESFSYPERVAIFLLITGGILLATRFTKERAGDGIPLLPAILVGIAQGIAIFPGISRSGITISLGLFLGLRRELAARFSFLISIPAILGAIILELPKLNLEGGSSLLYPYLFGTIAAAVSGYFSLALLIKMVRKLRLTPFGYYCLGVGGILLINYLGR